MKNDRTMKKQLTRRSMLGLVALTVAAKSTAAEKQRKANSNAKKKEKASAQPFTGFTINVTVICNNTSLPISNNQKCNVFLTRRSDKKTFDPVETVNGVASFPDMKGDHSYDIRTEETASHEKGEEKNIPIPSTAPSAEITVQCKHLLGEVNAEAIALAKVTVICDTTSTAISQPEVIHVTLEPRFGGGYTREADTYDGVATFSELIPGYYDIDTSPTDYHFGDTTMRKNFSNSYPNHSVTRSCKH